ncbi:MAG: c-type cytochrome [Planctomycetes bacterium]|nr:c-type cytochrome [Planctomycetota bacterium]
MTRICAGAILLCALASQGCEPATTPKFVSSEQVQKLENAELRQTIVAVLDQQCGTPASLQMLGDDKVPPERLELGAAVYASRCVQCHGASGDGNGPAAAYLKPRPRDYRRGIFKFTSTPYGFKPTRADLIRTVRQGITGTSMPSFALLPDREIEAVVDYALALTHRGELEMVLATIGEAEGAVDTAMVPDFIAEFTGQWSEAEKAVVRPLTAMPEMTAETIAAGKQAFLTKGCAKCHGEDGRGRTQENVGVDAWGHSTNAADLTSGMLHGGQRPLDVYRRIYSGINGTPMPSFNNALAQEPDTFWQLVHYVMHVANHRRASLPAVPQIVAPESKSEAPAAGDQASR